MTSPQQKFIDTPTHFSGSKERGGGEKTQTHKKAATMRAQGWEDAGGILDNHGT